MPEEKNATPTSTTACKVRMREGLCARVVYLAEEFDSEPVCLMHSSNPAKNEVAFHAEIERILEEAERTESLACFRYFVFPAVAYSWRVFAPACDYSYAIFAQNADFSSVTFTQDADFSLAIFSQNAYFDSIVFSQNVYFSSAKFTRDANFLRATFSQDAYFNNATFTQNVYFYSVTFLRNAFFKEVAFTQNVYFSDAIFTQNVYFNDSAFYEDAYFKSASFTHNVDFGMATFKQDASFNSATFTLDASFRRATFSRAGFFSETMFLGGADFRFAAISGAMSFLQTSFCHDSEGSHIFDFSELKVEHPERIEFYKTDLRHALFFNTDVSKFDFTLVRWREREGRSPRLYLFEEAVSLDKVKALEPLQDSHDERSYQLIAETYQQLKRNYDAKGDYWTAGHWHYGEMEMQRLHCNWEPRWARWLSQHLSLVALYKYTSAYGESYTLPLLWLGVVLIFFALAYPLTGLEIHLHDADKILSYWNFADFFRSNPNEHPQGLLGVLLHGAMASLSVAGFQRELRYAPSYPWGRLLALIEVLLTTTLGALFALAIRRQFKRS